MRNVSKWERQNCGGEVISMNPRPRKRGFHSFRARREEKKNCRCKYREGQRPSSRKWSTEDLKGVMTKMTPRSLSRED